MSARLALIIANTEYSDPSLAQLTAPGKDAEIFAQVLSDKAICAFDDVKVLLNEPESVVSEAIDEFFEEKKPDDLLLIYFSGHGVKDERGALYLAVKNTNHLRLRSTAIKSDFIRDAMEGSRAKRVVLILDCCNSGAFAQGTKAATGVSIGTASAFEAGYGRIVLTASDAIQFAWEGNEVIGDKTQNSLFTHFLVEGLQGEADVDGDGRITVDELYNYAYERVKLATPKQTPSKFSSKQQGEIILRQNIRIEDTRPVPLSDDLLTAINSSLPYIREGAVRQLGDLLNGRNLSLARSAQLALQKIAEEDDSRRISILAAQVLRSMGQTNQKLEEKKEVEKFEREPGELVRKSSQEKESRDAEVIKSIHQDVTAPAANKLITQTQKPELSKEPVRPDFSDIDLDLYHFIEILPTPEVPYTYRIGKYPITNAQYARFLNAPDYATDSYWRGFLKFNQEHIQIGRWGNEGLNWLKEKIGKSKKTPLPGYWEDVDFGIPNPDSPVVAITWYEANAYCNWLTLHWTELAESYVNSDLHPRIVRLPLDTEWTTAAGGRVPSGRFPWDAPGQETKDVREVVRRANVFESNIGHTTPVNAYLRGASPHGVMDMAGNVWEWQANGNMKEGDLLLCGGSWFNGEYSARVFFRNINRPGYRYNYFGFRALALPRERS